jgi:hypothetical protein
MVEVKSLARLRTASAINVLTGLMESTKCPAAVRVTAAVALLDRGHGRPAQSLMGEDGDEIKITIRNLLK